jgi:hypothetical protein
MTISLMAIIASALALKEEPGVYGLIGIMLLVSVMCNLNYQAPKVPNGWAAVNTSLGAAPNNVFGLVQRQSQLIAHSEQALNNGAKVILFPENIAVDWISGTQSQWRSVIERAKQQGATIILGAQQDLPDGSFNNVLLVLGKDGGRYYSARQPMPLGLWKPWSPYTYHAHWQLPGKSQVQGKEVAYLICYEQMVPWPILSSFMTGLAFTRLFRTPQLTAINDAD